MATADLTLLEKAALLSGRTVFETRAVPHAQVRSLYLADGPHGIRKQAGASDHLGLNASEPATCFPTAATVANSWDVDLAERVGKALGTEANALGVDMVLGPGLNIKRSPLCGRNFEYFSEDPLLAGRLAAGYVRGIQGEGVSACPKHFAVNSQEYRRMASDSVIDERTLRELYLTAFEIAVREGKPRAVMSSYNLINGTYANENGHLISDILRDEWGFGGVVVTDWGGGNDTVAGIKAGSTLEMPSPGLDSARQIVAAVESGLLDEATLDQRVAEMIALARESGEPSRGEIDVDAHHALAREVAERSAVLLKNEGGVLPFARGEDIVVIGDFAATPRYQGAGSSLVNATRVTTPLEALAAADVNVVAYAQGFVRGGERDEDLIAEAVAAAKRADVVLAYLGLDEISETEGRDRDHLRLPAAQLELLKAVSEAHPCVVVVLAAGAPVEIDWLDHCAALVHGYLGGQAGAEAIVNVVTGVVNPSGRLAETYPVALADHPLDGTFPAKGRYAQYREGHYVGYRYFASAGVPVRFPFGYGLSYTEFAYSDLKVTAAGASVDVTNVGGVAGADVVQLYISRVGEGIARPALELRGFARVEVAAGETVSVAIPLGPDAFRYFDVDSGSWRIEGGEFLIHVGANVSELPLKASLQVDGEPSTAREGLDNYTAEGIKKGLTDAEFALLLGRPVPREADEVRRDLDLNDTLAALSHAPSALARGIGRIHRGLLDRSIRKGKPDLNLLFQYGMPFRVIAKMTNGMVDMAMVEALLTIINGHFFKGVGRLVSAALHHRRTSRALQRALDGRAAGTSSPATAG